MFKQSLKQSHKFVNYQRVTHKCISSSYITDKSKLKSKYDVVIIGAGHNGLVAANYLAKFSKKKLKIALFERRHVVGNNFSILFLINFFHFSIKKVVQQSPKN